MSGRYYQDLHELLTDRLAEGEFDGLGDFGAVAKVFIELAIPHEVGIVGKQGRDLISWKDLDSLHLVIPPTGDDPDNCIIFRFNSDHGFDSAYVENYAPLVGKGQVEE